MPRILTCPVCGKQYTDPADVQKCADADRLAAQPNTPPPNRLPK